MGSSQNFQMVFDLLGAPDAIAYRYDYAWSTAVTLIAIAVGAFAWWRNRQSALRRLVPVGLLYLGYIAWQAHGDYAYTSEVRDLARSGQVRTVEGCLEHFTSGTYGGNGRRDPDEVWRVAGTLFRTNPNDPGPGYRLSLPQGGAIHADSRVRIAFVTVDRHPPEILRLEVVPAACPTAPPSPA